STPYPASQEYETKSNGQARTNPPRPANAWLCFRKHRTQQYKEMQTRRPRQADLSKLIGAEWRELSDADKAHWVRVAEKAKIDHAHQYPDYKYQPKRNPSKK
ncbi:hypothetical protein M422DRAFT_110441, partial [Sphaerobolus stellatus SS14]